MLLLLVLVNFDLFGLNQRVLVDQEVSHFGQVGLRS